jgi:hypothetical protein
MLSTAEFFVKLFFDQQARGQFCGDIPLKYGQNCIFLMLIPKKQSFALRRLNISKLLGSIGRSEEGISFAGHTSRTLVSVLLHA